MSDTPEGGPREAGSRTRPPAPRRCLQGAGSASRQAPAGGRSHLLDVVQLSGDYHWKVDFEVFAWEKVLILGKATQALQLLARARAGGGKRTHGLSEPCLQRQRCETMHMAPPGPGARPCGGSPQPGTGLGGGCHCVPFNAFKMFLNQVNTFEAFTVQVGKQEGEPERTFNIQKVVSIPAPRLMTWQRHSVFRRNAFMSCPMPCTRAKYPERDSETSCHSVRTEMTPARPGPRKKERPAPFTVSGVWHTCMGNSTFKFFFFKPFEPKHNLLTGGILLQRTKMSYNFTHKRQVLHQNS